MNPYDWQHCEVCDRLKPFKRFLGHVYNVLECLGCGSSVIERKEEAA